MSPHLPPIWPSDPRQHSGHSRGWGPRAGRQILLLSKPVHWATRRGCGVAQTASMPPTSGILLHTSLGGRQSGAFVFAHSSKRIADWHRSSQELGLLAASMQQHVQLSSREKCFNPTWRNIVNRVTESRVGFGGIERQPACRLPSWDMHAWRSTQKLPLCS
ncbi:hypothetical protein NDU88_007670 [Pleurodeles waltl]|uniref:Uncharacterized protein n=1 Tax=Pleurodeles waltl TaxID=8319 RepID=A0AAV7N4R3_PLEWA|nr:hypothetical protein NDU88_007670 [Pleurodeles waltl]